MLEQRLLVSIIVNPGINHALSSAKIHHVLTFLSSTCELKSLLGLHKAASFIPSSHFLQFNTIIMASLNLKIDVLDDPAEKASSSSLSQASKAILTLQAKLATILQDYL